MTSRPTSNEGHTGASFVRAAAAALSARAAEVDRLNVFPVPDGDTGTNMSLTMAAVIADVNALPEDAGIADLCHSVTHGSLMGARGNSGVILSQILRGFCEVAAETPALDTPTLAQAFHRSVTVAFQAVRKPVEGTILTVLRDSADEAQAAADQSVPLAEALERVSRASFDSVRRTPELLPVLKENGVVDAGGFGLAILIEGFVAATTGAQPQIADVSTAAAPLAHVEPVDDWDDDEYLYCTEFLLFGEDLDRDLVARYIERVGGSELVVGDATGLKIHVHTNDPGSILSHVTDFGEVAEVHINNMRRQSKERDRALRAEVASEIERASGAGDVETRQIEDRIGVVTIAAGDGLKKILTSLGADVVVNGGQTMNPSTKDILDAILSARTTSAIVLPNNRNILMAATAAAQAADLPATVVATSSIPEAFAALLALDEHGDLEEVTEAMTRGIQGVRSGEVTTAVKDAVGKVGEIKSGQVIGISDHEIETVGTDVLDVAVELATLIGTDAETLTVLAGVDLTDEQLAELAARLENALPGVEVETHRGDQPLYPVILGAE